jgi:aldehyde:ferredoxin oxidoreductase
MSILKIERGNMKLGGYAGKLLFVDLTNGAIDEKPLSEEIAAKFVGGYGIGARILYEMMKKGADPLGPDNVLGFVSGPLNATGALFGGRYTVVCKSPITGGWNDANSGGHFGPQLKRAGFDAVFISGVSRKPVYLFIKDGKAEIRDAKNIWGKDCTEGQEMLMKETGEPNLRAALIGPGGEKQALMACIINDTHRAAARGGGGAVMGSKNLKAVAVAGSVKIPVADPQKVKEVNREILDWMKNGPTAGMVKNWSAFGTGADTAMNGMIGDTPVKNWSGAGTVDIGEEGLSKLATAAFDGKYNSKKYACAQCPMGCGAHYSVHEGKWPLADTVRPEYETLGAFGAMALNDNPESIIKCNDICNRYGLDTMSVGPTIAWAIECYERGIFTKEDTQGIELTWGNADSIVTMTQAMADQSGFGKILALGSMKAADKLGKGKEYLQTVRGIELPMHDPRNSPYLARTYQCDPTPGRHIKGGLGIADLGAPEHIRFQFKGRGQADVNATCGNEVLSSAGACAFIGFATPPHALKGLIEAVTGQEIDMIRTGKRIFNMRHLFNLREGQKPTDVLFPARWLGQPPLESGPLKGNAVDYRQIAENFFEAIGWDKETMMPDQNSLEDMGMPLDI